MLCRVKGEGDRLLDLIVKNGMVVRHDACLPLDIGIKDGKIVALGDAQLFAQALQEIDAKEHYVLPGLIDAHVHIDQQVGEFRSVDSFYEASKAAALGGTTTLIDFAIPSPGETPLSALNRKMEAAKNNTLVHYSFHACITTLSPANEQEIEEIITGGFPSIKMFTVYRESVMLEMGAIYEVLKIIARKGGLAKFHAESAELIEHEVKKFVSARQTTPKFHPLSRPPIAEVQAVASLIPLIEETDAPALFVHVASDQLRSLLETYRQKLPIFTEVCPHYLVLTDQVYAQEDGQNYICCPPLRPAEVRDGLWGLLQDGLIDVVNSDHSGYTLAQKKKYQNDFTKIPAGLPGMETRGMVLFSEGVATGKLSIQHFVELTSTKVAKLMGLYPQKGVIEVGSDADLVLFDPHVTYRLSRDQLNMKSDYTPFEGLQMTGKPVCTIIKGEVVVKEGRLVNEAVRGDLLKRKPPHI